MRLSLQFLLSAIVLFLIAWIGVTPHSAFTPDIGLRLIQVQELVDQEWRSFAIPYPDQLDPQKRFAPYYYAYSLIEGELYFNISHFFPLLASFLYVALGSFGLAILPVLGGLGAAWATYRLVRLSRIEYAGWAFLGTLFATPVFFYSVIFWDHTFVTAFGMGAVLFVARGVVREERRWLVAGGAMLGLALGQRPEAYTLAIALGLSLLFVGPTRWKSLAIVVAGAFVTAVPLWILHYLWVGHPLGLATAPNLLGYGRPDAYGFTQTSSTPLLQRKLFLLVHGMLDQIVTMVMPLLILVGTVLILLSVRVRRFQHPRLLTVGMALVISGYCTLSMLAVAIQSFIVGLITTFPPLAFGLAYVRRREAPAPAGHVIYRLVFGTALIFVALMVLLWPADGGLQWGARYLLVAYPLLVYLALYSYAVHVRQQPDRIKQGIRIALPVLFGLSAFLQIVGVAISLQRLDNMQNRRETVASLEPAIVITSRPYLPSMMGMDHDKTFFYAGDQQQLSTLLDQLTARDIQNVAIFTSPPPYSLDIPARVKAFALVNTAPFEYRLEEVD